MPIGGNWFSSPTKTTRVRYPVHASERATHHREFCQVDHRRFVDHKILDCRDTSCSASCSAGLPSYRHRSEGPRYSTNDQSSLRQPSASPHAPVALPSLWGPALSTFPPACTASRLPRATPFSRPRPPRDEEQSLSHYPTDELATFLTKQFDGEVRQLR